MSLLSVCPRSAAQARGGRIASLVCPCGRRFHCNKFHARVAPAREPMFERGDDMLAVAAESAMIAVVQHDDVAAAAGPGARRARVSRSVARAAAVSSPSKFSTTSRRPAFPRGEFLRGAKGSCTRTAAASSAAAPRERRRRSHPGTARALREFPRATEKTDLHACPYDFRSDGRARKFPSRVPDRRAQISQSGKMSRARNSGQTIREAAE